MNVAIVAAAGRGERAGGGQPKQFREISGKPIIIHALESFERCETVARVVVVVPAGDVARVRDLVTTFGLRKVERAVAGGATRTQSTRLGLQIFGDVACNVVAVHDGARPLVTPEDVDRVVREAERTGAAILAAPASDTIKEVEGGAVLRTLERARLWHAQTPQCFRHDLLSRAYELAAADGLDGTDDSALVERLGVRVSVVEGSPHNVKITTPQDFALAEMLLAGRGKSIP